MLLPFCLCPPVSHLRDLLGHQAHLVRDQHPHRGALLGVGVRLLVLEESRKVLQGIELLLELLVLGLLVLFLFLLNKTFIYLDFK